MTDILFNIHVNKGCEGIDVIYVIHVCYIFFVNHNLNTLCINTNAYLMYFCFGCDVYERFLSFQLVHMEDAISQRNQAIQDLTLSLQQTKRERDQLSDENKQLTSEVCQLQQRLSESSDHDVKGHLSDLVKYESMIKEDSTRFYSAVMSSGSSLSSKEDQKDNDNEEITINYSRSDIKTSESSDDFPADIENKISEILGQYEEYIEENLKNNLIEKLMEIFNDVLRRVKIEHDTDVKQLELRVQEHKVEVRRLRELLANVKTGNADINCLREELQIKQKQEMENLRTYFEKLCSDLERR